MATHYGVKATRINSSDISSITITNCSIASQGDIGNGYEIQFTNAGSGCGLPVSFYIELRDSVAWSNISCEFYLVGTASCWSFNQAGHGAVAGNLISYNSTIDTITAAKNCFELPQFTKQMTICDNATTNMLHSSFAVGAFRSFRINRRRSSLVTPAGISHGRDCIGANGYTIVRNIFVW